jgi:hypothetical protein
MRRQRLAAVAVALLLVTAGCASAIDSLRGGSTTADASGTTAATTTPSPASPTPIATETPTPTATATSASTETATSASTETATAAATAVPRESPWTADPIVVGVAADDPRAYAPLVREATDYWEANDRRYVGYEVRFVVRPDAADPDVLVNVSDSVPDCGSTSEPAGCAPLVTDERQVGSTQPVWIVSGLSNESTVFVLKHEFGHLLGLRHGDPPTAVMRAASVLYTLPRPDAVDRAFPWNDSEFGVYADFSTAERPDEAREQVTHALTYYEGRPPGMPDNLTFEYVDDPEAADVTVEFAGEAACSGARVASCARTRGTDPDGDGAVETYTNVTITLSAVPTDATGWHVGYWLAQSLGAEDDAEKPPPFRNATPRERRSEWWE